MDRTNWTEEKTLDDGKKIWILTFKTQQRILIYILPVESKFGHATYECDKCSVTKHAKFDIKVGHVFYNQHIMLSVANKHGIMMRLYPHLCTMIFSVC